jgi:hypothetical protein
LKVSVIETIDEMPVWSADEGQGYERVSFRDMMAFLDRNERHLVLALRSGRPRPRSHENLGIPDTPPFLAESRSSVRRGKPF